MDAPLDPLLDTVLSATPEFGRERRQRMRLAAEATLRLAPHLACGQAEAVRAEDLRTVFLALDLFVFGARYRTAFENAEPALFIWRLERGDEAPVARLVFERTCDAPGMQDEPTVVEFLVAPAALEGDLVDGLLAAMLRLMALAACVFLFDDTRRGIGLAARLLRHLTSGAAPP